MEILLVSWVSSSPLDKAVRSSCSTTVVERKPPSRTNFRINRHHMDSTPNGERTLAVYVESLSLLGLDEHPDYCSMKNIKDVTWLSIEFSIPSGESYSLSYMKSPSTSTVTDEFEDRADFQETFEAISAWRNNLERTFFETSTALRHRSHRPSSKQSSITSYGHRRTGSHSTFSKGSEASEREISISPTMSSLPPRP